MSPPLFRICDEPANARPEAKRIKTRSKPIEIASPPLVKFATSLLMQDPKRSELRRGANRSTRRKSPTFMNGERSRTPHHRKCSRAYYDWREIQSPPPPKLLTSLFCLPVAEQTVLKRDGANEPKRKRGLSRVYQHDNF